MPAVPCTEHVGSASDFKLTQIHVSFLQTVNGEIASEKFRINAPLKLSEVLHFKVNRI